MSSTPATGKPVETKDVKETKTALQSLKKFNADILARYEEIEQQFKDQPLKPSHSQAFKTSIVEYLALVNQQYICYGTFRLPQDETDNPADAKVESLQKQGFVVSSSAQSVSPNAVHPAFAELPVVKHAIDSGLDLNGDNDE
jgi:hypothetical protein